MKDYMKKYVLYAEFDTKRGKDYFVAEERKTRFGVEYWDMGGGLWYMQNVESVPVRRYKSIESMQADTIPLYSKPPYNARMITPRYL